MIGVDLGGTSIRAVVLDRGRVAARASAPTPRLDPAALAPAVVACVRALELDEVTGIGLVTPGAVVARQGSVRGALNLGIAEDPLLLGPAIGALTGWDVSMANDVDAAALAAHRLLGLDDAAPSVLLSVGTGVAAGVVVGGRPLAGAHHAVGEIGHLALLPDGPRCGCGGRGCIEAVASGSAMRRGLRRGDGRSPACALLTGTGRRQRRLRAQVVDALALTVEVLHATLDPQCISLGGGVAEVGPLLLDPLQARLDERARGRRLLSRPVLRLAPDPALLGAYGAALLSSEPVRT